MPNRFFKDGLLEALFDDKKRPALIVALIFFGIAILLFFGLPYLIYGETK